MALPRSLEWWRYAPTKPLSSYSSSQPYSEELFFQPRNERERILEMEQRESWNRIKYIVPFFRLLGFQGKLSRWDDFFTSSLMKLSYSYSYFNLSRISTLSLSRSRGGVLLIVSACILTSRMGGCW